MRVMLASYVWLTCALSVAAAVPLGTDCPVDPGHVDLLAGQVDGQLVIVNGNATPSSFQRPSLFDPVTRNT